MLLYTNMEIECISSVSNEKIKYLKKLKNDPNFIFLETDKVIFEAIKNNAELIYYLSLNNYNTEIKLNDNTIKYSVSEEILKSLSNLKAPPKCIAVIKNKFLEFKNPIGNFLVLDNIQDPGNLGTIIRSCLGANFMDLYLLNCVRLNNDKVLRSSMGNIFKLRIYEIDKKEFISKIDKTKKIVYADMFGKNIFEYKIKDKIGVVIGNEGNGVSEEIKDICSDTIKIPMLNNLESLNAGVASSIIMYNITFGGK